MRECSGQKPLLHLSVKLLNRIRSCHWRGGVVTALCKVPLNIALSSPFLACRASHAMLDSLFSNTNELHSGVTLAAIVRRSYFYGMAHRRRIRRRSCVSCIGRSAHGRARFRRSKASQHALGRGHRPNGMSLRQQAALPALIVDGSRTRRIRAPRLVRAPAGFAGMVGGGRARWGRDCRLLAGAAIPHVLGKPPPTCSGLVAPADAHGSPGDFLSSRRCVSPYHDPGLENESSFGVDWNCVDQRGGA